MEDDDNQRTQGVNLEDVDAVLVDLSYPVTSDELLDEHGERTIDRTNAEPISLRELLAPLDEETFETADEVRQTLLSLMPADSVGRQEYSDRGGSLPDEPAPAGESDEDESV